MGKTVFDTAAIAERVAHKTEPKPKPEPKTCVSEGCDNVALRGKLQLCQTHRDEYEAQKSERYAKYAQAINEAGEAANKVTEDDDNLVLVRGDFAKNGFAYFLREAMPAMFWESHSKTNPKGHTYGGFIVRMNGTQTARTWAEAIKASGIPKDEGFWFDLITVERV
jgi:stalled ribosome rescue protein Dom34